MVMVLLEKNEFILHIMIFISWDWFVKVCKFKVMFLRRLGRFFAQSNLVEKKHEMKSVIMKLV